MYSQPAKLVSTPPAISPKVAPLAPMPPHSPSALLRSAPSSNMFMTIDSAAGRTIAAPSPCRPRMAIRNESVVASAAASDAVVKAPSPIINTRRRPRRSAARPPSSRKPPNAIPYAVTTHSRLVCEKWRSRPIVGRAVLTIVRSMTVMNAATASSENARQRWIFEVWDIIGPPVVCAPPPGDGLTSPTQPVRRFGQPRSEIPQAAVQLRTLDGVGTQLDRRLVGARGALAVARAPEQLRMGGVQRLVALERRLVQQQRAQIEARPRARRQ